MVNYDRWTVNLTSNQPLLSVDLVCRARALQWWSLKIVWWHSSLPFSSSLWKCIVFRYCSIWGNSTRALVNRSAFIKSLLLEKRLNKSIENVKQPSCLSVYLSVCLSVCTSMYASPFVSVSRCPCQPVCGIWGCSNFRNQLKITIFFKRSLYLFQVFSRISWKNQWQIWCVWFYIGQVVYHKVLKFLTGMYTLDVIEVDFFELQK